MNTPQMTTNDLLIEFLTEELPPINLEKTFGITFANLLTEELANFTTNASTVEYFVTPRRFGTLITQINNQEPSQNLVKKGPGISSGLENGQATKALIGFMKSCGISDYKDLEQKDDGYFYATTNKAGQKLEDMLPFAIKNSLKKLPIAKNMHWGNHDYTFVRPVHNLMILHGGEAICRQAQIFGLTPVNYTFGHRIMSQGKISINHATTYIAQMTTLGKIIPEFQTRKDLIRASLEDHAKALNLQLIATDLEKLLDEVTALVEYPVVLQGEFATEFLSTPQECLILSMAKNQKYFALTDKNGKLTHTFLFVANIASHDAKVVIHGNEKVLSARLADAKFFFDTDKKHPLEYFLDKLNNVVYQNKLGSQGLRIERLQKIAAAIAPKLNVSIEDATIATSWLKADLMTEMVGEFPELQGIMGKYYALHHGVNADIADSIEKHYYPRFSGDTLPDTPLATLMSITDKLELLVGIWGIGLIPTGEKDPFALRRVALGLARILLEYDLDLIDILAIAIQQFTGIDTFNHKIDASANKPQVLVETYNFILQRLTNYLVMELNFKSNVVQAVLKSDTYDLNSGQRKSFVDLIQLLNTLHTFAADSNNQEFFGANKRIENILRKNVDALTTVLTPDKIKQHLQEAAEKELLDFVVNFSLDDITVNTWDKYALKLEQCSKLLANFFENVMVMAEDTALRNARLSLLLQLRHKLNYLCNMSELVT